MASPATDRNLLFGILAMQMDFVAKDALIQAMQAWVFDKAKPLGEILGNQGKLKPAHRQLLDGLVEAHIREHDNDPQKSLAALSSIGSAKDDLNQIADPDVQASLVQVSVARADDAYPTRAPMVGEATSAGSRFRILRPHARGGLGEIFVAEDAELHREVALKEIQNRHADKAESRARFVLEAEITGGLEHPGIVPVYGLGQYADGRPFYAMRFIRGDSLKEAIANYHTNDQTRRNPGERAVEFRKLLGRFIDVCNAVAYAHSRGVLHRDLKPGNIMLGKYGETLVVDWGLAKPLGRKDARSDEVPLQPQAQSGTAETVTGSAIGTPQFMSPEQAGGRTEAVGPASDVYSLGATLYTLLTGQPPFTVTDTGEVLRRVQRGEFPAPRQVNRDVPRPLEAICLKAMALKPEERYATPRDLVEDVEHWLADEPVKAYRDPLRTRVSRWGRRNKTVVAAAVALLMTAVTALSAGVVLLERKQAEIIQERNAARKARDEAQTVANFFQDHILAAPRPKGFEGGASPQVTLHEVLDRAAPQIDNAFAGQPALEASVRHALGVTYFFLGKYDAACKQGERAYKIRLELFGADHPDTIRSAYELAEHLNHAGKHDQSADLFQDVLKRAPGILGPNDEDVLYASLRLGSVLNNKGQRKEAEDLLRQGISACKSKLGEDHHHSYCGQARLGDVLGAQGRAEEALDLKRKNYEGRKRVLGEEAYDTLLSMGELGSMLRNQGKLAEAEPILQLNLELRSRVLGAEHALTLYAKITWPTFWKRKASCPMQSYCTAKPWKLGCESPDQKTMTH